MSIQTLAKDLFEFREILLHGGQVKNKISYILGILFLFMSENPYIFRRDMQKGCIMSQCINIANACVVHPKLHASTFSIKAYSLCLITVTRSHYKWRLTHSVY